MQLRKVAAGAIGALMAGATFGFAATLDTYPAPFAAGGSVNSLIVVGATAASSDVVGAVDLGARLAGESYTEVATGGTTTGTTSGGSVYSKDIPFDTNISSTNNFKTPLKAFDVTALKSGTVAFDGSSYSWEERFEVTNENTVQIETSSSTGGTKDMKDVPYLRFGLSDLVYNWTLTQSLNSSKVTTSVPLNVNIMGKAFKITDIGNATFTATVADEKFLRVAETYTVEGKIVKLTEVGSDVAIIEVDGTTKTISKGSTELVNGLNVKVVSVVYHSNNIQNSAATLQVGKDITKTYVTGDPFPGEPTDGTETWEWDLSALRGGETVDLNHQSGIAVRFAKSINLLTDSPAPLAPGQSLNLPGNYLKFGFDSVTTHNVAKYTIEYVSAVDLSGAGLGTAVPAIKISTSQADGLTVSGTSTKTKTVYLDGRVATGNGTGVNVAYVDSNGAVRSDANDTANRIAQITFQDTTLNIFYRNVTGFPTTTALNITQPSTAPTAHGNISIEVLLTGTANDTAGFGDVANSAESDDVTILGTELGDRDEDVLTDYGLKVRAPKSNAGSDRVIIDVPSTQLKGFLSVRAGAANVANTTGGTTTKSVVPVTGGLAKLDTSITDADKTAKHLILVGGPCRNTLVQQIAAAGQLKRGTNGTDLTCNNWPGENFGIIRVVDNYFATGKSALIVAGTRAEETTLGTQILRNFAAHAAKLKGTGVEYSGADISSVVIK